VLLPVGISFHTFQSVSYNIDVYRGKILPERKLGIFALFVAYFPQLVAGPIERGAHILPQFHAQHSFDYNRVVRGLQLAAWGMFKKVVIADRLAIVVNRVFDDPSSHAPTQSLVAVVFFAFQIYCDFSGYSDIAVGCAEVLGVNLVRNFQRPYLSSSIGEFWKRWHISLSSWFRDYVYIPLGGSRESLPRWYVNILITFLASGLWHGAQWTFVLWGGLNGCYLIAEIVLARHVLAAARWLRLDRLPRLLSALRIGVTFALTCVAWCFFRAKTATDAIGIARALPVGAFQWFRGASHLDSGMIYTALRGLGLQQSDLFIAIAAIFALMIVERTQESGSIRDRLCRQPAWVRWGCYYGLVASILFFGAFNASQQFIYFQF
jgi:D-alanyl-lipoteichoic acid acyltransferase DltB (MBOAT superfamily)